MVRDSGKVTRLYRHPNQDDMGINHHHRGDDGGRRSFSASRNTEPDLSVDTRGLHKAYPPHLTDLSDFFEWHEEMRAFLTPFRVPLVPPEKNG